MSCIPLSGTTVTAPAPISPLLCQEFLLQKLLHLLFNLSQAAVQSPDGALLLAGAGWRWELALVFFQHLQHLLLFQGELLEEGQRLYQPSLTLLLLFLPGSSLLSPSIITSTCFIQVKKQEYQNLVFILYLPHEEQASTVQGGENLQGPLTW